MKGIALSLFVLTLASIEVQAASPPQQNVPIRISSEHFKRFFGQDIDHIEILILGEDGLSTLPVQWTQLTDEDTVYTQKYKKISFSGDTQVLDPWDRLELMYQDTSALSCGDTFAARGLEIVIQPKGSTVPKENRYVCLVLRQGGQGVESGRRLRPSTKDYGTYDESEGRAMTSSYQLYFSQKNPLIWNDFYYKGVNLDEKTGRVTGDTILDSLKINIQANFLTKLAKIRLDNRNLRSEVVDVQEGPIYDSLFAKTKVKLAGATVLNMQVMLHFYPDHVEMKTRFKVPRLAKSLVNSPRVDVSLDANNMWGSQVLTSWGPSPDSPLVVNGVLDKHESDFTEQEVSPKDSWIWYSTTRGFDLFTFLEFDDEFQVPIALVYDDDKMKEVEPERFVGQGPNVGYSLRGMVYGRYFTFTSHLLFSDAVQPHQVESHVSALRDPWIIESGSSAPATQGHQDLGASTY